MKKILIGLFCYSVLLYSCDNEKKEDSSLTRTDSTSAKKDSLVKGPVAKNMIDSLKDKKLKFKGIVWARFDSTTMRKIYSDSNVIDVVFFVGVLPDTSAKKKDAPVILLQIKRKSTTAAPLFEYYTAGSFCPPPNDGSCGTVEVPSSK